MNQEIDNQLLISVLDGDSSAKKIFIDLCMKCIWGALARFDQLTYEDKQDLVSNIIYKEIFGVEGDWGGIKKYRGDSKFTTYLYGIVTFRALDFLKSKGMKYKNKIDSIDNAMINLSSEEISVENMISLNDAFSILKDNEREIVVLYSEGYKHREIAEKIGASTNTVSSILSRSYQKMKQYMQEK
tara:strand:- start:2346 stop:2900 length:555 start_codon:yes stop_codon:yes gene_type:complete